MNILILGASSDLYGGSKILAIVANILQEGKHKPIVVVSEHGELIGELNRLGVEVRIIRLGILRRKYFSVPGILNRIKVNRSAWKALGKLIDEEKIDIVYSNTTGVLIGAFLAKKKNIKHIWHIHEIITKPKTFTRILGRLVNKYADNVIVVSDAVKNHWKEYINTTNINRIYNGIDTSIYTRSEGLLRKELNLKETDLVIGMIGRVNHWKGQDFFIDIARQILNHEPDTKFIIAGDAYPGNEHLVDKMLDRLNNELPPQSVFYIGYRTDIPSILKSIDIFVLPSILPDPFPTVILEAMASSKPVVATNHGGALEMVAHMETGIIIPHDNVEESAGEILKLIRNKEKIATMGELGNIRINTLFSLEKFRESILRLFAQTLDS
ncbi:glycosyltransferase family 4 protein [Pedobacter agri]|uniref:Glycosyltransferase family 4 protein n=1 Tax=Pedobacter agri TaxID=454586 RepID=A0A9X3DAQ2_9SPHI|nr:glycosyltransferase family 4 protein [Pedobacter agri]MCX3264062.1 glycosyltransferase family 4 protein [Pedobacter agri]